MSREALLNLLTGTEGYTQQYMRLAVDSVKKAIETTVGINAESVKISWTGSDSTFL